MLTIEKVLYLLTSEMASMGTSSEEILQNICKEFWKWRLEESPEFATTCNVHEQNHKLTVRTEKTFEERMRKCKEFLELLSLVKYLTLIIFMKYVKFRF